MKRKSIFTQAVSMSLVLMGLVFGGCITGQSEEPDYFVLEIIAGERPAEADFLEGKSYHVAKTEIPVYLDSNRMVSRTSGNQLVYAEFHRWGETLDAGITRVVANDLAAALGVLNFSHYPNRTRPGNRYEINITVQRFERVPSGEVIFEGSWRLFRDREQQLIAPLKESSAVKGLGHAAAVNAMSFVLRRVSDRIAVRFLKHIEEEPASSVP